MHGAQCHIQRLFLEYRCRQGVGGQPVSSQTVRRTQIGLHGCCPIRKSSLKMMQEKAANSFLLLFVVIPSEKTGARAEPGLVNLCPSWGKWGIHTGLTVFYVTSHHCRTEFCATDFSLVLMIGCVTLLLVSEPQVQFVASQVLYI